MMDGSFSHDLTGAMALISGGGRPMSEAPFIKTPGLLARPADGVFAPRPLRDTAVALPGQTPDAPPLDDAQPPALDSAPIAPAPSTAPTSAPAPTPEPAPAFAPITQLSAAQMTAALTEARAQARAEVLAELAADRATLADTARSLAAALTRITQPPASDLTALNAHLGQAVAHLAAQRAGQAIDADAAPFARRIMALATRVTDTFDQVSLRLHPDDAQAIAALLQDACPPDLAQMTQARLRPDPSPHRGDVALHTPTTRLQDLLALPAPQDHQGSTDD
jgi:flagellar biosynthesis/type III secretory pathway protein FliH